MSEVQRLFIPATPEDPPIPAQLMTMFTKVAQDAGGYVVAHPEEHCINVVFGAHQVEVKIIQRR